MQVKTGEAVGESLEQGVGIEKTEAPFDLGVAGIVPIDDLGRIKPVHKSREIGVWRQFEDPLAILHREPHSRARRLGQKTPEIRLDPVEGRQGSFPETRQGPLPPPSGLARPRRERFRRREKGERNAPGVQHDLRSPDALRQLEGLQGMPQPGPALEAVSGRRLKEVRGRPIDFTGERAEIVDTAHLDHPLINPAQNPRHKVNWNPVAELDAGESKFAHFGKHRKTVGVPVRTPAGRKGEAGLRGRGKGGVHQEWKGFCDRFARDFFLAFRALRANPQATSHNTMDTPSQDERKIRLLQIVDSLHQGGMENIMVQVCNRLDPGRFEITVCCLSRTGPFAERLREGIKLVSLEKAPGFSLATVKALRSLIHQGNFDLIHTHHLGGLIYTGLARLKPAVARPRLIHSEHIILHGEELSWRRILQRKLLYRLASCVFTVSSQQLDQLQALGLTHRRQFTLRNGVDGARFHPLAREKRAEHRQKLGLDPDRFWIGKVARFAALKRHQPLIEGFERAARENPALGLLLLGDNGSEKERVLAQIAASPVRDRIVWAGLQQDPLPWYQAMDLLVIASESEGMPNAALESMACGVPVLANEVCGVREVAGDGSHSWIEDLGSADLIASSLARISALPAPVLAATGVAARLHAETELSLEAMMERYRRLYSGECF